MPQMTSAPTVVSPGAKLPTLTHGQRLRIVIGPEFRRIRDQRTTSNLVKLMLTNGSVTPMEAQRVYGMAGTTFTKAISRARAAGLKIARQQRSDPMTRAIYSRYFLQPLGETA